MLYRACYRSEFRASYVSCECYYRNPLGEERLETDLSLPSSFFLLSPPKDYPQASCGTGSARDTKQELPLRRFLFFFLSTFPFLLLRRVYFIIAPKGPCIDPVISMLLFSLLLASAPMARSLLLLSVVLHVSHPPPEEGSLHPPEQGEDQRENKNTSDVHK